MAGAWSLWGELLFVLWFLSHQRNLAAVHCSLQSFCTLSVASKWSLRLRGRAPVKNLCQRCAKVYLSPFCSTWPWVKRHAAKKKAAQNAV